MQQTGGVSSPGSISWFRVTTGADGIRLDVRPPGRPAWQATLTWESITRVCFAAEGPWDSDSLYIFTSVRPESWVMPTEGVGGADLLNEMVRRGVFDAAMLIRAAKAPSGLFCWPPEGPPAN